MLQLLWLYFALAITRETFNAATDEEKKPSRWALVVGCIATASAWFIYFKG